MNKLTPEQGDAVLVAINMLTSGKSLLSLNYFAQGEAHVREGIKKLQELGVPISLPILPF